MFFRLGQRCCIATLVYTPPAHGISGFRLIRRTRPWIHHSDTIIIKETLRVRLLLSESGFEPALTTRPLHPIFQIFRIHSFTHTYILICIYLHTRILCPLENESHTFFYFKFQTLRAFVFTNYFLNINIAIFDNVSPKCRRQFHFLCVTLTDIIRLLYLAALF